MPDGPTPAALVRPVAGAAFDCRIDWGKGTGGGAPGGLPLTFRFSRPGGGEPPASSGWPRLAAGNPHPRPPGAFPGPCAALSWARLSVSPAPPSPDGFDVPIIPRGPAHCRHLGYAQHPTWAGLLLMVLANKERSPVPTACRSG